MPVTPPYNSCVNRAVCDEKRRRLLVRQLQQAEKMSASAGIAVGLAHDFKNILTTIRLHSDLAGLSAPAGTPCQQHLASIREATIHANALLERLSEFARPRARRVVRLKLHEQLHALVPVVERALGRAINVNAVPCPPVRIDRVELQQILWNCAMNARRATSIRGQITISVRPVRIGAVSGARFEPALKAGDYVQLVISDSGEGMTHEVLRDCSRNFHHSTAKHGWGLGLAVVHSCAARAGGGVRISSQRGRGTRVGVLLPVAAPRAQAVSY